MISEFMVDNTLCDYDSASWRGMTAGLPRDGFSVRPPGPGVWWFLL